MFYIALAINLVVLGVFVAFVVRLSRASPEKRSDMLRPKKRTVILWVGAFAALLIVTATLIFSFFGITGIRATSAAEDYLKAEFGARDNWEITLDGHTENSKKPQAGAYEMSYRYGEKEGRLLVEYLERDGKLTFHVIPKKK